MSSKPVRDSILDFLENNTSESVVDITGHYEDLTEMLADNNVQPDAAWLGVDFVPSFEEPISLTANNIQGLYRERGIIQLHVCEPARPGAGDSLVSRGEILRKLFRGRRIGSIVIEGVIPLNTGPGATLEFEGGYVSGTVVVEFYRDSAPD